MGSGPLATPRRVAFAGDWHGNGRWARHAIAHAHKAGADVLLHLGDFGYDFAPGYLRTLAESPIPIAFVDGNHEDFETLACYPVGDDGLRRLNDRVWHLPRGFRWTWDGIRLLACGGAYSVDRSWRVLGESWWAEEEITDDDVQRCVDGGPADVLIAHDCPTEVVIPGIDDRTTPAPWPAQALAEAAIHRRQVRRIVDEVRPSRIWHGHYHVAYEQRVDLGYGPVDVVGLDCDGTTLAHNVRVADLDNLRPTS